MDLNACVVRDDNEVLVIDTGSSPAEAAAIEVALQQLGWVSRRGRHHRTLVETDLVMHVPDAGTWIVGDLVEESGPPM